MLFEDEEFSNKKEKGVLGLDLNLEDDDWTIVNGELKEYKNEDEEKVIIPDGVTAILPYAFKYKPVMTEVIIPKSVKRLDSQAFYECVYLEKVVIENENIQIFEDAFTDMFLLEEMFIGGKQTDCLITQMQDRNGLCFEKYLGEESELTLPDGIERIGDKAFELCNLLNKVNLPDSLRDIDLLAFDKCISIDELRIPPYVQSLGNWIFKGWKKNQTIYVPKNFKRLSIFQAWRKGCRAKIIYY